MFKRFWCWLVGQQVLWDLPLIGEWVQGLWLKTDEGEEWLNRTANRMADVLLAQDEDFLAQFLRPIGEGEDGEEVSEFDFHAAADEGENE